MSLDVYLTLEGTKHRPEGSGIFVRENGQTREITKAEWDERFPGREPIVARQTEENETVFEYNITHNLAKMAGEAGIYEPLWHPEDIGITEARQLIEPLKAGFALLLAEPERFKKFNPSNGWGDYEGLVKFVAEYLEACKEYPSATISARG